MASQRFAKARGFLLLFSLLPASFVLLLPLLLALLLCFFAATTPTTANAQVTTTTTTLAPAVPTEDTSYISQTPLVDIASSSATTNFRNFTIRSPRHNDLAQLLLKSNRDWSLKTLRDTIWQTNIELPLNIRIGPSLVSGQEVKFSLYVRNASVFEKAAVRMVKAGRLVPECSLFSPAKGITDSTESHTQADPPCAFARVITPSTAMNLSSREVIGHRRSQQRGFSFSSSCPSYNSVGGGGGLDTGDTHVASFAIPAHFPHPTTHTMTIVVPTFVLLAHFDFQDDGGAAAGKQKHQQPMNPILPCEEKGDGDRMRNPDLELVLAWDTGSSETEVSFTTPFFSNLTRRQPFSSSSSHDGDWKDFSLLSKNSIRSTSSRLSTWKFSSQRQGNVDDEFVRAIRIPPSILIPSTAKEIFDSSTSTATTSMTTSRNISQLSNLFGEYVIANHTTGSTPLSASSFALAPSLGVGPASTNGNGEEEEESSGSFFRIPSGHYSSLPPVANARSLRSNRGYRVVSTINQFEPDVQNIFSSYLGNGPREIPVVGCVADASIYSVTRHNQAFGISALFDNHNEDDSLDDSPDAIFCRLPITSSSSTSRYGRLFFFVSEGLDAASLFSSSAADDVLSVRLVKTSTGQSVSVECDALSEASLLFPDVPITQRGCGAALSCKASSFISLQHEAEGVKFDAVEILVSVFDNKILPGIFSLSVPDKKKAASSSSSSSKTASANDGNNNNRFYSSSCPYLFGAALELFDEASEPWLFSNPTVMKRIEQRNQGTVPSRVEASAEYQLLTQQPNQRHCLDNLGFLCPVEKACINVSLVCDGDVHCSDGADEARCSSSSSGSSSDSSDGGGGRWVRIPDATQAATDSASNAWSSSALNYLSLPPNVTCNFILNKTFENIPTAEMCGQIAIASATSLLLPTPLSSRWSHENAQQSSRTLRYLDPVVAVFRKKSASANNNKVCELYSFRPGCPLGAGCTACAGTPTADVLGLTSSAPGSAGAASDLFLLRSALRPFDQAFEATMPRSAASSLFSSFVSEAVPHVRLNASVICNRQWSCNGNGDGVRLDVVSSLVDHLNPGTLPIAAENFLPFSQFTCSCRCDEGFSGSECQQLSLSSGGDDGTQSVLSCQYVRLSLLLANNNNNIARYGNASSLFGVALRGLVRQRFGFSNHSDMDLALFLRSAGFRIAQIGNESLVLVPVGTLDPPYPKMSARALYASLVETQQSVVDFLSSSSSSSSQQQKNESTPVLVLDEDEVAAITEYIVMDCPADLSLERVSQRGLILSSQLANNDPSFMTFINSTHGLSLFQSGLFVSNGTSSDDSSATTTTAPPNATASFGESFSKATFTFPVSWDDVVLNPASRVLDPVLTVDSLMQKISFTFAFNEIPPPSSSSSSSFSYDSAMSSLTAAKVTRELPASTACGFDASNSNNNSFHFSNQIRVSTTSAFAGILSCEIDLDTIMVHHAGFSDVSSASSSVVGFTVAVAAPIASLTSTTDAATLNHTVNRNDEWNFLLSRRSFVSSLPSLTLESMTQKAAMFRANFESASRPEKALNVRFSSGVSDILPILTYVMLGLTGAISILTAVFFYLDQKVVDESGGGPMELGKAKKANQEHDEQHLFHLDGGSSEENHSEHDVPVLMTEEQHRQQLAMERMFDNMEGGQAFLAGSSPASPPTIEGSTPGPSGAATAAPSLSPGGRRGLIKFDSSADAVDSSESSSSPSMMKKFKGAGLFHMPIMAAWASSTARYARQYDKSPWYARWDIALHITSILAMLIALCTALFVFAWQVNVIPIETNYDVVVQFYTTEDACVAVADSAAVRRSNLSSSSTMPVGLMSFSATGDCVDASGFVTTSLTSGATALFGGNFAAQCVAASDDASSVVVRSLKASSSSVACSDIVAVQQVSSSSSSSCFSLPDSLAKIYGARYVNLTCTTTDQARRLVTRLAAGGGPSSMSRVADTTTAAAPIVMDRHGAAETSTTSSSTSNKRRLSSSFSAETFSSSSSTSSVAPPFVQGTIVQANTSQGLFFSGLPPVGVTFEASHVDLYAFRGEHFNSLQQADGSSIMTFTSRVHPARFFTLARDDPRIEGLSAFDLPPDRIVSQTEAAFKTTPVDFANQRSEKFSDRSLPFMSQSDAPIGFLFNGVGRMDNVSFASGVITEAVRFNGVGVHSSSAAAASSSSLPPTDAMNLGKSEEATISFYVKLTSSSSGFVLAVADDVVVVGDSSSSAEQRYPVLRWLRIALESGNSDVWKDIPINLYSAVYIDARRKTLHVLWAEARRSLVNLQWNLGHLEGVDRLWTGTWHHIALTWDATTKRLRLFVDGQSSLTVTGWIKCAPSEPPEMLASPPDRVSQISDEFAQLVRNPETSLQRTLFSLLYDSSKKVVSLSGQVSMIAGAFNGGLYSLQFDGEQFDLSDILTSLGTNRMRRFDTYNQTAFFIVGFFCMLACFSMLVLTVHHIVMNYIDGAVRQVENENEDARVEYQNILGVEFPEQKLVTFDTNDGAFVALSPEGALAASGLSARVFTLVMQQLLSLAFSSDDAKADLLTFLWTQGKGDVSTSLPEFSIWKTARNAELTNEGVFRLPLQLWRALVQSFDGVVEGTEEELLGEESLQSRRMHEKHQHPRFRDSTNSWASQQSTSAALGGNKPSSSGSGSGGSGGTSGGGGASESVGNTVVQLILPIFIVIQALDIYISNFDFPPLYQSFFSTQARQSSFDVEAWFRSYFSPEVLYGSAIVLSIFIAALLTYFVMYDHRQWIRMVATYVQQRALLDGPLIHGAEVEKRKMRYIKKLMMRGLSERAALKSFKQFLESPEGKDFILPNERKKKLNKKKQKTVGGALTAMFVDALYDPTGTHMRPDLDGTMKNGTATMTSSAGLLNLTSTHHRQQQQDHNDLELEFDTSGDGTALPTPRWAFRLLRYILPVRINVAIDQLVDGGRSDPFIDVYPTDLAPAKLPQGASARTSSLTWKLCPNAEESEQWEKSVCGVRGMELMNIIKYQEEYAKALAAAQAAIKAAESGVVVEEVVEDEEQEKGKDNNNNNNNNKISSAVAGRQSDDDDNNYDPAAEYTSQQRFRRHSSFSQSSPAERISEKPLIPLTRVVNRCPLHKDRILGLLERRITEKPPQCFIMSKGERCTKHKNCDLYGCGALLEDGVTRCPYALCSFHTRMTLGQYIMTQIVSLYRSLVDLGVVGIVAILVIAIAQLIYFPVTKAGLQFLTCDPRFQCFIPRCWSDPDAKFLLSAALVVVALFAIGIGVPLIITIGLYRRWHILANVFYHREFKKFYLEVDADAQQELLRKRTKARERLNRENRRRRKIIKRAKEIAARAAEHQQGENVAVDYMTVYKELESKALKDPELEKFEDDVSDDDDYDPTEGLIFGFAHLTKLCDTKTAAAMIDAARASEVATIWSTVSLKEWDRYLTSDTSLLFSLYRTLEFEWMLLTPLLLMYRLVIVTPSILLEQGSVNQLVAIAVIETVFGLFMFWAQPYVNSYVDTMFRIGSIHNVGIIGLSAFRRVIDSHTDPNWGDLSTDLGATGIDIVMTLWTFVYYFSAAILLFCAVVLPMSRQIIGELAVADELSQVGMRTLELSSLFLNPLLHRQQPQEGANNNNNSNSSSKQRNAGGGSSDKARKNSRDDDDATAIEVTPPPPFSAEADHHDDFADGSASPSQVIAVTSLATEEEEAETNHPDAAGDASTNEQQHQQNSDEAPPPPSSPPSLYAEFSALHPGINYEADAAAADARQHMQERQQEQQHQQSPLLDYANHELSEMQPGQEGVGDEVADAAAPPPPQRDASDTLPPQHQDSSAVAQQQGGEEGASRSEEIPGAAAASSFNNAGSTTPTMVPGVVGGQHMFSAYDDAEEVAAALLAQQQQQQQQQEQGEEGETTVEDVGDQ